MANKRIFYAVERAGFSKCGENSFTSVHGLQSVGVNTRFKLEQVFEISQLAIYQNIEDLPDIEVTMEKVLDGYPLIYHLATNGATSASLSGRSNIKATVGLAIYSDSQDSASGAAIAECNMSGVYVSALNYNFPVQGNFSESVTLVGNNKVWNSSLTFTDSWPNTDVPFAAEGVNRRQHMLFGATSPAVPTKSLLPTDIPGITASGTNEKTADVFGAHVQSIKVSCNLGRDQLLELGRRGPYHRYLQFPAEVRTDIEVLSTEGDKVTALEDDETNLSDQKIYLMVQEGTKIDLGTKNKLNQVTYGGANAGANGGNATCTYSYTTFNDLIVTHPEDPSGL